MLGTWHPMSSPTSRARRFDDLGDDRVRVTGVRGTAATDTYKALLCHHAGWAGEARVAFSWPDAARRRRRPQRSSPNASRRPDWRSTSGASSSGASTRSGGPTVPRRRPPTRPRSSHGSRGDAPTRLTAGLVGREMVPLTLSAPPAGMTGMGRGAGRPTELLGIWPTLVEKSLVDPHVTVHVEEV